MLSSSSGFAVGSPYKGTRADRFRETGFERDGGESHPLDQKAKQSIPEREWLVSAVHGLSESDYMGRAYR
jgi:hypothetical protein